MRQMIVALRTWDCVRARTDTHTLKTHRRGPRNELVPEVLGTLARSKSMQAHGKKDGVYYRNECLPFGRNVLWCHVVPNVWSS